MVTVSPYGARIVLSEAIEMNTVATILTDLEGAISSRSEEKKNLTIVRVMDMFVAHANDYSAEQVSVFDVVIGKLAVGAGAQTRIDLSERLADLRVAPHGVVRQLALDEIGVARPVLTRSIVLTEGDLIAVASTRGRDHMLAITDRLYLTESVTDYLMVKGDRVVSHALAHNETARFSARGMGLLVTRAFSDEALQVALGGRNDVPPDLLVNLSNAVRNSTRRRLMTRGGSTISPSQQDFATDGEISEARKLAAQAITDLHAAGRLDEAALSGYAQRAATDEAICAMAELAKISIASAEQAILGSDRDACVVIAKAMGWDWTTVMALISLRPAADRQPHQLDRALENYESLSNATAHRVMRFMRVKEQTASDTT